MDMDYPDLCEWDRLQDQFTEKVKRILFDLKRIFG